MAVRMQPTDNDARRARWHLPASHVESLVTALKTGWATNRVTVEQRAVIREICNAPERALYAPEDFLIAFKLGLVEAANTAHLAPGPQRNDLLTALVSVYIDEFFSASSLGASIRTADRQETAPGH
jgi:hypothetical protein